MGILKKNKLEFSDVINPENKAKSLGLFLLYNIQTGDFHIQNNALLLVSEALKKGTITSSDAGAVFDYALKHGTKPVKACASDMVWDKGLKAALLDYQSEVIRNEGAPNSAPGPVKRVLGRIISFSR